MKSRFTALLLLGWLLCLPACENSESGRTAPVVRKGVLDLRDWDVRRDGPVKLDGEWEFYWQRFVSPADFAAGRAPEPDAYVRLPGAWNDFEIDGRPVGGQGFATYRLVVRGAGAELLGLKLPEIKTAFRAYAGGRLVARAGRLGRSPEEYRPQYRPVVAVFPGNAERLELILQVSNFQHRYGGPVRTSLLGEAEQMNALRRRASQIEWFLLGGLIMMGLYHFGLFSLRRRDLSLLYFALFSLLFTLRILTEGEHLFLERFPDFDWELFVRIQYLSTRVQAVLLFLFMREIFPNAFPAWVVRGVMAISLLFSLPVLFAEPPFFTQTGSYYAIFIVLMCLYTTGALIASALQRRQGARIFLVGWLVFLGTILNDILHDLIIIQTAYLASAGIVFFFFSQAALLALRASRAFQTARELSIRLQTLDRLKDDFLANTSHELRTPVNGIIGITESILDGDQGPISDGVRRSLDLVIVSGRRLGALVNDILDSVKLKHRSLELQRRPIDLRPVVAETLFLCEPLAYGKEIDLRSDLDELPAVYADENRLKQILYNLIGNAVKFTERGTVRVTASAEKERMRIVVADTGIGIPPGKLRDIFHTFEQADTSISRKYGGAGLGLSITRQLVEMHGGTIHAESLGKDTGARFVFYLPISAEKAEPPAETRHLFRLRETSRPAEVPADPAAAPGAQTAEAEPFRVLVVDDDPVNLQLVVHRLRKLEYEILTAPGGYEALRILSEGPRPDLVLLDVMMPEISGYEVLKMIRKSYPAETLPVILLTARDQVSDLVTGFQAGASDYVTKPIIKEELIMRVQYHLRIAASYRRLAAENRTVNAENRRVRAENRRLQGPGDA